MNLHSPNSSGLYHTLHFENQKPSFCQSNHIRVIHILRDETSRLVLKIHAPDSVLIKNLAMYNYQSAKPSEFICGCSFICPELFLDTMYTGLMTIKLISQFTFKEEGYIQTFCILAQETSRTQPIKSLYEEVKRAGA